MSLSIQISRAVKRIEASSNQDDLVLGSEDSYGDDESLDVEGSSDSDYPSRPLKKVSLKNIAHRLDTGLTSGFKLLKFSRGESGFNELRINLHGGSDGYSSLLELIQNYKVIASALKSQGLDPNDVGVCLTDKNYILSVQNFFSDYLVV